MYYFADFSVARRPTSHFTVRRANDSGLLRNRSTQLQCLHCSVSPRASNYFTRLHNLTFLPVYDTSFTNASIIYKYFGVQTPLIDSLQLSQPFSRNAAFSSLVSPGVLPSCFRCIRLRKPVAAAFGWVPILVVSTLLLLPALKKGVSPILAARVDISGQKQLSYPGSASGMKSARKRKFAPYPDVHRSSELSGRSPAREGIERAGRKMKGRRKHHDPRQDEFVRCGDGICYIPFDNYTGKNSSQKFDAKFASSFLRAEGKARPQVKRIISSAHEMPSEIEELKQLILPKVRVAEGSFQMCKAFHFFKPEKATTTLGQRMYKHLKRRQQQQTLKEQLTFVASHVTQVRNGGNHLWDGSAAADVEKQKQARYEASNSISRHGRLSAVRGRLNSLPKSSSHLRHNFGLNLGHRTKRNVIWGDLDCTVDLAQSSAKPGMIMTSAGDHVKALATEHTRQKSEARWQPKSHRESVDEPHENSIAFSSAKEIAPVGAVVETMTRPKKTALYNKTDGGILNTEGGVTDYNTFRSKVREHGKSMCEQLLTQESNMDNMEHADYIRPVKGRFMPSMSRYNSQRLTRNHLHQQQGLKNVPAAGVYGMNETAMDFERSQLPVYANSPNGGNEYARSVEGTAEDSDGDGVNLEFLLSLFSGANMSTDLTDGSTTGAAETAGRPLLEEEESTARKKARQTDEHVHVTLSASKDQVLGTDTKQVSNASVKSSSMAQSRKQLPPHSSHLPSGGETVESSFYAADGNHDISGFTQQIAILPPVEAVSQQTQKAEPSIKPWYSKPNKLSSQSGNAPKSTNSLVYARLPQVTAWEGTGDDKVDLLSSKTITPLVADHMRQRYRKYEGLSQSGKSHTSYPAPRTPPWQITLTRSCQGAAGHAFCVDSAETQPSERNRQNKSAKFPGHFHSKFTDHEEELSVSPGWPSEDSVFDLNGSSQRMALSKITKLGKIQPKHMKSSGSRSSRYAAVQSILSPSSGRVSVLERTMPTQVLRSNAALSTQRSARREQGTRRASRSKRKELIM